MKNPFVFIKTLFSSIISQREKPRKKRSTVGGWKKEVYSKVVSKLVSERFSEPGISEHAIVCESAEIDESASVAAGAYIGANVKIGAGSRIYPNATILDDTVVGRNVVVGSGAVIGGEGFGFYEKSKSGKIKHIPQLAKVIIEDEVYIGSNTSINRGSVSDTKIGNDTKINCNVHIAHNVQIGKSCLIMAGVSINGSTKIGNNVVINPQSAISKHITIGEGAEIGINSTVIRDVAPNTRVLGSPAKEK